MGHTANFPSSWSSITDSFILSSDHRPNSGAELADAVDDIPVISLTPFFDALGAQLTSGSDWAAIAAALPQLHAEVPAIQSVVTAIGQACAEWGFFQVVDHEVPPALLPTVKHLAKEFFSLPLEEKRRIGRSFDRHLGYTDCELTKNTRDWKEILDWAFLGHMEMPETVESDYK